MSNSNEYLSIFKEYSTQRQKENYIANMLVNTLYSNDVSQSECYQIIKLFKQKVLGDINL